MPNICKDIKQRTHMLSQINIKDPKESLFLYLKKNKKWVWKLVTQLSACSNIQYDYGRSPKFSNFPPVSLDSSSPKNNIQLPEYG